MCLPVKQKMLRWSYSFVFIFFNTAIIICVLVLIYHMDNWKIEKQSVISRLESMVQRKEYFDSICEKYKSPTRCKKSGCCKTTGKLWQQITETLYGVFLVFLGSFDCQIWAIFHFGTLWA